MIFYFILLYLCIKQLLLFILFSIYFEQVDYISSLNILYTYDMYLHMYQYIQAQC